MHSTDGNRYLKFTNKTKKNLDVLCNNIHPLLKNFAYDVVSIDGMPTSGKTTIGRWLASQFNISLIETDLFMHGNRGSLVYNTEALDFVIKNRLERPSPVIVEGVLSRDLLYDLGIVPTYTIRIEQKGNYYNNCNNINNVTLRKQLKEYKKKYLKGGYDYILKTDT